MNDKRTTQLLFCRERYMIELLYFNINRKECIMATREQEWEELLGIKTSGRDDSHSDGEHHPYEPTDYCVLERLANSGLIRKRIPSSITAAARGG